jgi:hypothetical protein
MEALRYSNLEILSMPDCEGLLENGKCRWLNTTKCEGAGCNHYQKKSSFTKAQARLCSLDEDTQERIAKKYYSGFRPWVDSSEVSGR